MLRVVLLMLFPLFLFGASENIWVKTGQTYGIEPRLLYAMAKVESDIDRFIVSLNFSKMTPQQQDNLENFLAKNGIESKKYTKVISIKSKNINQAKMVVTFLYNNRYPHFDTGIMQINSIHKEMLDKAKISFYDLFDPKTNIQVGAYILATCFEKHKNNKDAINAYNGKVNDNPYSAKVFAEFKKLYTTYQKDKTKLYYRASL